MIRDFLIENRVNPIGIDENPRFSWKLESDHENVVQVFYQIQVVHDGKMVWDSGKVESECSVYVPYMGEDLLPMTRYQVQVSVWDNYEEVGQKIGFFETGVMKREWNAKWITHTLPVQEVVVPVFKMGISSKKEVKAARLYATAQGVYEAYINGRKVGDDFMAPGWTSYHKRLQYQTYDVTALLQRENIVEITVANGWFKGSLGFDEKSNNYGDRVALLAMIRMEYADGTYETIGTDENWNVSTGNILDSEIYHGEIQNYLADKKELGNAVLLEQTQEFELVSQESETVSVVKRFSPIKKIITPKGELVIDFGQNITGLVEVTLPELVGEKLVIRHAETLDKNGNFYMDNLRSARCTDEYIYGVDQVGRVVMPHFTFHGFRYICVEGVSEDVDEKAFVACAMHTNMKQTGFFHTSNALINQLQSNIEWGQRDNFFDIPTDCPQRNERLGWTGDAQVFAGTASYNFNTLLFFKKWLRDMTAETTEEWGVPHVVPNILADQEGAAAWSDAATIIPWQLYKSFGDKKQLEENYPLMKAWVSYMDDKISENGLWQTGFQYGDWLALDIEAGSIDRSGGTDKYLVANSYYAYSTSIVRDAAQVLGYEEDYNYYKESFKKIKEAINKEYITATGRLVCETQTACVLMLYFDLAKEEYKERIRNTLERNIGAHRNHLTTGFVGTPYLCHCLSEAGLHTLANEIVLKEDFPGWLYAVKKGATTIWERWNSVLPNGDFDESGMNSLNHYAYGSIGSWFYEKVAGITPLEPGYKKIQIKPALTRGMEEACAVYDSIYGIIKSSYACKNGKIVVNITIPANTTANVLLPEKEEWLELGSGKYTYEYETNTSLQVQKYSFDSTLGELVAEPLAVSMFNEMVPGMLDNPMTKFAYDMTISDLAAMAMETRPLYQSVINALNLQ